MIALPPVSGDGQPRSDIDEPCIAGRAFERHFTPKDLAKLWHKDEGTIRRIFRNEPGVMCFESMNRRKGTRRYVSLSIPKSIVVRVHQQLENKEENTKKTRPRKDRISHMTDIIRPTSLTGASEGEGTGNLVDDQWERELLRTAQRLRNRLQNRDT
jgi:hypothetical protein